MHPIDALRADHRAIRTQTEAFEARLDALANTRRWTPEAALGFGRDLEFYKGGLARHIAREEAALLPAMERRLGRHGDSMVDLLWQEHRELERALRKIEEAIAEASAGGGSGALEELNRHGLFFVQVLQDHVRKEEIAFFERCTGALTAADWDAVAEAMAAVDTEKPKDTSG